MTFAVKDRTTVYIKEEVTEGTYVAPAAGSDAILPLTDGLEMSPAVENIERNNLDNSIGKSAPRKGQKSVSASISVEAKAHGTAGTAPEYGLLVESALGAERSNTAETSTTGHTATVINFTSHGFNIGDIVLVKESGAYHVSPITAITGTSITLLVAASGAFSDSVVVEAVQTYYTANSGHPRLSVTKYVENAIEERGIGMAVSSMALANFATGQIPQLDFSLEGLNHARSATAPSYTPAYDAALPPITLSACVYLDGSQITLNEFNFSVENELGFISSTCDANGRTASRVNARSVSGSINPYKSISDVSNYNKFTDGTLFSLFAYASVPTGTAGEIQDVIGFYLPNCYVTELGEADQDGILQDSISFMATRGNDGSTEEVYVSMT